MDKINKMLNPPKPKKKTEGQIFELPKGLSKKEKKEKKENVKETKKILKKGKKAYVKLKKKPQSKTRI